MPSRLAGAVWQTSGMGTPPQQGPPAAATEPAGVAAGDTVAVEIAPPEPDAAQEFFQAASPTSSDGGRPELADEVLVARAASGDPRAFETLVRRHQAQMFRVALRITGRADDAEDAAQNAFIAAWRRLPEFRQDSSFATWLYRIVTNQALNQVRSRQRSDQHSDIAALLDADQPASTEPGPEARTETSALLNDLRSAIARLPDDLRTCWYAREVDGHSYQEVAVIAGVSFDVARGRIFRARQRLAEDLKAWR